MKKKIGLLVLSLASLSFINKVNAASVSVSASSNYITNGNKVTFYIKIDDAASWTLNGYGIGATSGCSLGDERVGDSGTGRNGDKTLTVSCRSSSTGIITFTVTGSVWDENYKETKINSSKSVTVQAPREKDSNNYLKSLSIKEFNLTPEFDKEKLEYTVTVPSTTDKITIEASKASNYASLEGTGEFEVNEGVNTFEVKVMSETGTERVYKLTVNVEDENPIEINIGEKKYTIMKNAKTLETPATYEKTTIKIKEFDIPAFYSETSKMTLVGIKDTKGTTSFAIYNQEKNTYQLYNETKTNQLLLYIQNIPEPKEGFIESTITINNQSYPCLKLSLESNYILIYAMDIVSGKEDYYVYDKEDSSVTKYNDETLKLHQAELEKYKQVILGFGGALLFSGLLNLILLLRKPKYKKKKTKESINAISEVTDVKEEQEEIVKEDVIKEHPVEEEKFMEETEEIKLEKLDKKKKKTKKEMASVKEEGKDEKKVQKEVLVKQLNKKGYPSTSVEAIQKVADATEMIEQFEKTIKLSKQELKEKNEELKEQEEEMYDLFEEDKKKKKKRKK